MKKLWLTLKGIVFVVFGGGKKFDKFLLDHSDDAFEIVACIKGFVESEMVITLLSFFPKYQAKAAAFLGRVDDILDQIIVEIGLGVECFKLPTSLERLTCFVDLVKKLTQHDREVVYRKIAAQYLIVQSPTYTKSKAPIAESLANTIVEMKLQEIKADIAGIKPANVL